MTDTPTNRDDIIDSRDLIAAIEELEGEQDGYIEDFENALEALEEARAELADADPIEQQNGLDPSGELTKELEDAAKALCDYWDGDATSPVEAATDLLEAFRNPEDGFLGNDELHALKLFADELEGYCEDWHHGTTIIRDSYFEEYAQEFAEDIGAINPDARWPNNCIDWEQAARELQVDYTSAEFDGVTYWAR